MCLIVLLSDPILSYYVVLSLSWNAPTGPLPCGNRLAGSKKVACYSFLSLTPCKTVTFVSVERSTMQHP